MSSKFKTKINNVAIVYRPNLDEAKTMAKELSTWLKSKKIKVYSHPKRKFKANGTFAPAVTNKTRLDLVVVLGGDGTYLEAVRMLSGKKIPILGINLGSLGFLTENPSEDLYKVLTMTLEGNMEMRPRTMLQIKLKNKGKIQSHFTALNDMVIERGSRSHLISVNLSCDQLHVSEMKADGIIVSSPTGSTAYNLAAGGPILHPETNCFVVTPICPHSLTNRPLIFPNNLKLKFKLTHSHKASLTVDGATVAEINENHEVIVEQCQHCHFVLKKPSHNFFDLLNKKLKFGQR